MNKVILMGRLTREPELRYSQGENPVPVVRYTLAVSRGYRREGEEQNADFISCVAFRKGAEFAGHHFHQGIKVVVSGQLRTGNYVNREGQKVYTTDVIVSEQEFAEGRSLTSRKTGEVERESGDFMNIAEGIEDEVLPFS